MTNDLLSVRGLRVEVGGRRVLENVDLRVSRGEVVGVVGETGSGKSMTCRAVTGLLGRVGGRAVSGSIDFDGLDLLRLSSAGWRSVWGRRIALVSQSSLSGLDPIMRIGRQLRETIKVLAPDVDASARASELLEAVRMPQVSDVMHAYPHELSGGMRQRVVIALALAGSPDLLLADEPTTALDVTVQRGILELLAELREQTSMGLVLITHDLQLVRSVADRVVVMYAGRTVEDTASTDIFAAPGHPYTQALLAAQPSNAADGQMLYALPGAPPSLDDLLPGCPFAPRCPHTQDACKSGPVELRGLTDGRRLACVQAEEVMA